MAQMKLGMQLELLAPLHKTILGCKKCELCKDRKNAVPGEGNEESDLVVIGEAPGRSEDESGRPFIGRAGKVLTDVLSEAGISRDNVFITNIIKCRPPKNRVPKKDEVEACRGYLLKQVELIRPRLLIALGQSAFKTLTGLTGKMENTHGKIYDHRGYKVLVTYHPAGVIYNRKLRPSMVDDLKKIAGIIRKK